MPLVKLVSSGLGLAFEANAALKAHKADKSARVKGISPAPDRLPSDRSQIPVTDELHGQAKLLAGSGDVMPVDSKGSKDSKGAALSDQAYDDAPPVYAEAENMDEADQHLDEVIPDTAHASSHSDLDDQGLREMPRGEEAKKHYVDKIVQNFIFRYPPPFEIPVMGGLPCPVIIPQRRPHKKSRGFVRAYAPALEECGIDQDGFMSFHRAMFKASQASPVFDVINLAAAIAGVAPSLAAMVTSMVVQAATRIAIEIQSRQRTNSFLNQINDQFFRPRGLFCMVMKYDPQVKLSHERVDISTAIMKSIVPSGSRTTEQMKRFKTASAETFGEIEMPQAAPLIFPGLDHVEDIDEKGKPKGGFKKTGEFLANYYDKRAQAEYAVENQGSTLASAMPQEHRFASRFGDPNHPVNSGSLISLVTGGHINPSNRESAPQNRRHHRDGYARGSDRDHSRDRDGRGGGPLPIKYVRRMLRPNMLYLMVVNMPTEEEMADARAIIAAA